MGYNDEDIKLVRDLLKECLTTIEVIKNFLANSPTGRKLSDRVTTTGDIETALTTLRAEAIRQEMLPALMIDLAEEVPAKRQALANTASYLRSKINRRSDYFDDRIRRIAELDGLAAIDFFNAKGSLQGVTSIVPFLSLGKLRQWCDKAERCICRVRLGKTSIDDAGTGFLISEDLVLTCYHVVEACINAPEKIFLFFDHGATNVGLKHGAEILFSKYSDADLAGGSGEPSNDELDFAVLKLAHPVGTERGYFDTSSRHRKPRTGEPIIISGHPGPNPPLQALQFSMAAPGFEGFNSNCNRLIYKTSTDHGSSGSPVFDRSFHLIGLHHNGGQRRDERFINNRGIPIDRILDKVLSLGSERNIGAELRTPKAAGEREYIEQLQNIQTDNAQRVRPIAEPGSPDAARSRQCSPSETPNINLVRLPITGEFIFGHEKHVQYLHRLWKSSKCNVVTLTGWGGSGKSNIVNHLLAELANQGWASVDGAFGWTFSKQSAAQSACASADDFFNKAFEWVGTAPMRINAGDRGERLAALIQTNRVLLVLDGLEPLQHGRGPRKGRITDPELATLIRALASKNHGLCVVTTRAAIADIASFTRTTAAVVELGALDDAAGEMLLRALGVSGPEGELREASRKVKGHALTLNLLGSYLREYCDGRAHDLDRVLRWAQSDTEVELANSVMSSYEGELQNLPELDFLRLLSVFDRAAAPQEVEELLREPAIPGVSPNLVNLSQHRLNQVIARLRGMSLLEKHHTDASEVIDVHPLVRAYFAARLKAEFPSGWSEANNRLYKHLALQSPLIPETIEHFTALCEAASHGCRAGKHVEVFDELYLKRICPQTEETQDYFSRNPLGGVAADLAALSDFFEEPWSAVASSFDEAKAACIMNASGIDLWNLGRLKEALPLVRRPVEIATRLGDSRLISRYSGDLSELYQFLGQFKESRNAAEVCVLHADRCGVDFLRCYGRVRMGDLLNNCGDLQRSELMFREAEEIQGKMDSRWCRLHSVYGYWFCDLLLQKVSHDLSAGRATKLVESLGDIGARATESMEWARDKGRVLDFGHAHLLLARVKQYQSQFDAAGDFSAAEEHAESAVAYLRRACQQDEIPRGLVARAEIRLLAGNLKGARADLKEALEIAVRGSMPTHLADIRLVEARLYLACSEALSRDGKQKLAPDYLNRARTALNKSSQLVARIGFHGRDLALTSIKYAIQRATCP